MSAFRDTIARQWSGYWLDPGRQPATAEPPYRPTGAVLRRIAETSDERFVCLDLVLAESGAGFLWVPLSEAGRYTYAHSLGLLQGEPWRLMIWEGGAVRLYQAAFAESIAPEDITVLYGADARGRARPDRPAVQLRLDRIAA